MARTKTPATSPARTFTHQLREAIRSSGLSPYAVAKEAGIGRDLLSRFLRAETGLQSSTVDALWVALRLRITVAARRSSAPRSRPAPVPPEDDPADEPV